MSRYLSDEDDKSKVAIISKLVKELDCVDRKSAHDILFNLMKYGISRYMAGFYTEQTQTGIIEKIFNKIIFAKFGQEYQRVTTYFGQNTDHNDSKNNDENNTDSSENSDDDYFKCIVFNTDVIMSKIFEYLTYETRFDKGGLFACSLVCSHWLYHAYHVNSTYYVDLYKLIKQTLQLRLDEQNDNSVTRMWQRLSKAKSIYFDVLDYNPKISNYLKLKLSMFRNVEIMEGLCYINHMPMLQAILKNCKDKIKKYDVNVRSTSLITNKITNIQSSKCQPFELMSAKYIKLYTTYYDIKWSNKCQTLILNRLKNIGQDWCNFIIQQCDCSNIKLLHLNDVTFSFNTIINHDDRKCLAKFAQQFENLHTLQICFNEEIGYNVLNLIKLFKPIMDKNNCQLELKCGYLLGMLVYGGLVDIIRTNNLQLHKAEFGVHSAGSYWAFRFECMKRIINSNINCLMHLKICNEDYRSENNGLLSMVKYLQKYDDDDNDDNCESKFNDINCKSGSFQSLNIIEIADSGTTSNSKLSIICKFLKLPLIIEKKLFVITNLKVNFAKEKRFDVLFASFCKQVSKLLIKFKNQIDIKVTFEYLDNESDYTKANQTYLSYFEEKKLLQQYEEPDTTMSNNMRGYQCAARVKPQNLFYFDNLNEQMIFHVSNVEYHYRHVI